MAHDTVIGIDPNFSFPEGLSDVVQIDANTLDYEEPVEIDLTIDSFGEEYEDLHGEGDGADIPAPEYINVVSQTVRTAPDGRQVIDVVIEVESVMGALNYEMRVTKE